MGGNVKPMQIFAKIFNSKVSHIMFVQECRNSLNFIFIYNLPKRYTFKNLQQAPSLKLPYEEAPKFENCNKDPGLLLEP